jgi:prophage regulatory protein
MEKYLSKKELRALTTLSIQTVTRLEQAGRFPKRVWLTQNRVAWWMPDVLEWMHNRKIASE